MSGRPDSTSTVQRVVHREVLALLLLSAAGGATFLITRVLALSNAALRHADAVTWHEQGRRALDRGDTARALSALRKASRIDRDNRDVSVSLAMALRAAGEDDQATAVLEALRASRPDDAEVNLQLARLEADRGALPAAIRYYQDALDALWAPSAAERSRTVRREFITLLQQHGERARALSQALVYAAELPPAPESQLTAARLLFDVGDPRRALDRYRAVLAAAPRNAEALAGAGEAAFALGDYAAARRYLAQSYPADDRLDSLRRVSEFVLNLDPLASRISRVERERRLQQILQHADDRLAACGGDAAPLRSEVAALRAGRGRAAGSRADVDSGNRFEDGIALARQVAQATASCGAPDELDRAVAIIARDRGLEAGR
jgi:tetratricopeptide (TPR) repeat protein